MNPGWSVRWHLGSGTRWHPGTMSVSITPKTLEHHGTLRETPDYMEHLKNVASYMFTSSEHPPLLYSTERPEICFPAAIAANHRARAPRVPHIPRRSAHSSPGKAASQRAFREQLVGRNAPSACRSKLRARSNLLVLQKNICDVTWS